MRTRTLIPQFLLGALVANIATGSEPSMGPERVISDQDFDEFKPQVAYNSVRDEYLVVWHDSSPFQPRSILGKRVDHMGNTVAEFIIAFEDAPPRDNGQPTVAYDPVTDRYFVAWIRDFYGDDSDWDVYARIVPGAGPSASFPAFVVCSFASSQWSPRAAYGSTNGDFLVTWWNAGGGSVHSYISAQRVSSSGVLLGGNFAVSSGAEDRVLPDVAYNQARNEYLIVYQLMDPGYGDIYGIRLSASGAILGGGDFGIAAWPDTESAPRVAASGVADEWAVVWQSDVPGSLKDVFARRVWVDGAGVVQTAPPMHLAATGGDEQNPDIAAHPGSTTYLVAWEQAYAGTPTNFGIWAKTLSTANSMGESFTVRTVWGGGAAVDSSHPEIAAAPTDWFVVWEQDRIATPSYQDIYGRAVTDSLFTDGFETGDPSGWDVVTP